MSDADAADEVSSAISTTWTAASILVLSELETVTLRTGDELAERVVGAIFKLDCRGSVV